MFIFTVIITTAITKLTKSNGEESNFPSENA